MLRFVIADLLLLNSEVVIVLPSGDCTIVVIVFADLDALRFFGFALIFRIFSIMKENSKQSELYIGPKAHFVPTKDKATGRIRTYKNPKDARTGMRIKFRSRSGKVYKFRRLNPSIGQLKSSLSCQGKTPFKFH